MIQKNGLTSTVALLARDRRGAAVAGWAICGAAILGLTGAALDLARAEAAAKVAAQGVHRQPSN